MDNESEKLKNRRKYRLKLLKKLLKDIGNLQFDNTVPSQNDQYPLYSDNRKDYQSPLDRSTYNYGYMNINEIGAGTPNTF